MRLQEVNYLTRKEKPHPEDTEEKISENDLSIVRGNEYTQAKIHSKIKIHKAVSSKPNTANKSKKSSIWRKKSKIKIKTK